MFNTHAMFQDEFKKLDSFKRLTFSTQVNIFDKNSNKYYTNPFIQLAYELYINNLIGSYNYKSNIDFQKSISYLTSADICNRYNISKTTLWRWQTQSPYNIPFPSPDMLGNCGSSHRYSITTILEWENLIRFKVNQI